MKQYNYQTVSRTMLGDLHTPVSTYLKVRDIFPQSALMESSDYHGSENSRSFIGLCPVASFSIDHGISVFRLPDGTREERPITEEYHVENALHDFLNRFHVKGEYSNYYGLYGYTSFNAVRYFENIAVKDSREATKTRRICYIYYINTSSSSTISKTRCCCWRCLLPARKANWTRCRKQFTTATTLLMGFALSAKPLLR